MNIQISCDDFEVTDKIKAQIEEKIAQKLEKLLDRHLAPDNQVANLRLEQLTRTKEYKLSFDMSLPGKSQLYATNKHKNFISALVGLREQLERQAKKYLDDSQMNGR